MKISKFVNDCITGKDGKTVDPARVLWILGVLSFLIFIGHHVYKTGEFNMTDYGMAYGALLAAGGFGVKIKESTEPDNPHLTH